jgi:hypothetical protein
MEQSDKLETNARGQRLDHSTSKLGRAHPKFVPTALAATISSAVGIDQFP